MSKDKSKGMSVLVAEVNKDAALLDIEQQQKR